MPPTTLTTNNSSPAIPATSRSASRPALAAAKRTCSRSDFCRTWIPPANDDADPTELRQLIAITFTDAAAREMRARIRNACYDRLDDPSRLRNRAEPGNGCSARSTRPASARSMRSARRCSARTLPSRPRSDVRRARARRSRRAAAGSHRRRAPRAPRANSTQTRSTSPPSFASSRN